jgi:hypothetical protein
MNAKTINQLYTSVPQEVKTALIGMGISIEMSEQEKPTFNSEPYCGVLPTNLDDLETSEIVELMSAHIVWTRYVNGLLSDATVQLRCREDALSAIKQSVIKSKGKDVFEYDADYLDANHSVLWYSALKTYLETASDMCSTNYKVLSRVITLKGQDQEQNIRLNSAKNGASNASRSGRHRPWVVDPED